MNLTDFEKLLRESAALFDAEFEKHFDSDDADLTAVTDAMAYSALAGGKRIRPFLVLEFCRLFGGDVRSALPLAAALECVHTYSLIHDDLPCMDNDDLRRGKPTCHKVYGEEFALLAGDALLTKAFEIITDADALSEKVRLDAVKALSSLAGVRGMIGGQTIDLQSEGKIIDFEKLLKLHALKTGALIRCAAYLGAISANARPEQISAADRYAERLGLAFQIADDILDVTSTEEELGKPIGSDSENGKVTFLSFMSIEEATSFAERTANEAADFIRKYENCDVLCALAEYTAKRRK